MAKKEENPLFVGITDKDELRKGMLECSKGILESLKFFESFKSVREEKAALTKQLKGDLKDISRSINALKNSLPHVKDGEIKKPEVKKAAELKPKIIKKAPVIAEKPSEKSEIEKLESELNEIEDKLNSLS
ncbi:MAG: hypothetical protein ABIH64_04420 [Nanoarchaeota archaeon]